MDIICISILQIIIFSHSEKSWTAFKPCYMGILKCHQSFIVNMDYIANVKEDFILIDGAKIPIHVRQHKLITETYYHFFVKNRT